MLKLRNFKRDKLYEMLRDATFKESQQQRFRATSANAPATATGGGDELVSAGERDEMVAYVLEVCDRDDMALGVDTFALCVALLDRSLASFRVKSKYLECLAVACLYIACKAKEEDENVSTTASFLRECGSRCSVAELLRMELMVLNKFEWTIDEITVVDFAHIYHALLISHHYQNIDSEQQLEQQQRQQTTTSTPQATWKNVRRNSNVCGGSVEMYAPACADFMHLLETQLKQVLCVHELTDAFRPHVLAFTLLSIQVDRLAAAASDAQPADIAVCRDALARIQQSSKIGAELVRQCTEQIGEWCAAAAAVSQLCATTIGRTIDEHDFDLIRNYRLSLSAMMMPLSQKAAVDLPIIKEEDEEDDGEADEEEKEEEWNEDVEEDENELANSSSSSCSNSSIDMDTSADVTFKHSYLSRTSARFDKKSKAKSKQFYDTAASCLYDESDNEMQLNDDYRSN